MIVLFWPSGTSHGATSLICQGEARFTLVHSSLLSGAGGGDAGWQRSLAKAATLCSLLGYASMEIEGVHQYKHPMHGISTRSGATVSTVECFSAENRPGDAFGIDEFDTNDPKTRKSVQSAIDAMLLVEEEERKRDQKLADRTPEEIAEDEARRKAEIERLDEENFAEALKKLEKALRKRRKRAAGPPKGALLAGAASSEDFASIYRLEESQALKLILPPFPNGRLEFYRSIAPAGAASSSANRRSPLLAL